MDRLNEKAAEVAHDLLERTELALFSGDFALFRSAIYLPYLVETDSQSHVIRTQTALADLFDNVSAHLNALGATVMDRRCIHADFLDAETLACAYKSRIVSGVTLVEPPYMVRAQARIEAGAWRFFAHRAHFVDSPRYEAAVERAVAE